MSNGLPNLLEQLDIDPAEFNWMQLRACKNYPVDMFFDDYEKDTILAKNVDQLCLGCPVTKECFSFGVKTKSTGVFGGFYLINGEPSKTKNGHKTPEIAAKLAKKVFDG